MPVRRAASTRPTSCSRRTSSSLTRFAAVFQTTAPDPVGPIRSGRTQDVELLGSLNKPIFAWSGGNPGVTRPSTVPTSSSPTCRPTPAAASKSYRSRDARCRTTCTRRAAGCSRWHPEGATPPPLQFSYRKDGEAVGRRSLHRRRPEDGRRQRSAGSTTPAPASICRFQSGKAHNDAALGQVDAQPTSSCWWSTTCRAPSTRTALRRRPPAPARCTRSAMARSYTEHGHEPIGFCRTR